jgi:hypothetical protein
MRLGYKVRKNIYNVGRVRDVLVLNKVIAMYTWVIISRGRRKVMNVKIGLDRRSGCFWRDGRENLLVAYPLVQQAGAPATRRVESRGNMKRVFVCCRVGRVLHLCGRELRL